ncbi:MAG: two-component regulator propeller domain-containing protein [Calditrichaceae bacterium]
MSHSWILDILQDKYHFMWFAAANGLNKYDGYTFEVFQHSSSDSSSIPQSIVSDIFEDSQGIIWIGTGDGLSRFNRENNNFINYYPDSTSLSILGHLVQSIIEDHEGRLWISTSQGLNLYDRDTDRFTQFRYPNQNLNQISPPSPLGDMLADKYGNIWIGTLEYGLIRFNIEDKSFKQYILVTDRKETISNSSVTSIKLIDNTLWIGTLGSGLFKLNVKENDETNFINYRHDPKDPTSLNHNNILSLLSTPENKIWIGTENFGLDSFDPETGKFFHNMSDDNDPYSLNNSSVYSLFKDSSNNIWVGTYAGGINVSFVNLQDFELYRNTGQKNSISNNVITSFLEDDQGNLWIGTDGGGLNYWDRKTGIFDAYSTKNTNLISDAIQSLAYDMDGNLWISSWEGGISRFDERTHIFYHITSNEGLPDNNVISFIIDNKNRIWAGCFFSGLVLLDKNGIKHKIFNHVNSGLKDESVRLLHEMDDGIIVVGTDNGVFFFNPNDETFKMYQKERDNINSLSGNQIYAIAEQNNGILWFGTGYGLNRFDLKTKQFSHFFKKNGLPSNMIVGLEFDAKGDLWISTDKGLACMNVQNKKIKTYTISDGLQGNQFNIRSHYLTRENELLFGGTKGFNIFHPESLKTNIKVPKLVFTNFQIFNESVLIGNNEPLEKHISVAQEIDLTYKQSVFSLEFAALSYEAPELNQYAYKMEGFDEEWTYCGNKRNATYTNLSPGEYTFRVKASNNDGYWNESGKSIRIIIHPPYWQTIWFRITVVLVILIIISTFHIGRINNEKARNRLLEESVEERTKELKALNDELESFAFSVSHDLRAPLRTINGFTEIINQDHYDDLSEELKEYFNKINVAGTRMGQLIEDLLKLTRIGRLDMEMSRISMSTLVHEIYDHLRLSDPERKVTFKIQPDLKAFADKRLVRILLDNLIQNAWKYTRNESNALIEFGRVKDKPVPSYYIKDNGVGFDMSFAHKLFNPFVRLHNENEFEGTGVGLATVKRIVDRHNGQIWIKSGVNKGTTVFFNFGIS